MAGAAVLGSCLGAESDGDGHWFVLAPQASPQYLPGSGADNGIFHCTAPLPQGGQGLPGQQADIMTSFLSR